MLKSSKVKFRKTFLMVLGRFLAEVIKTVKQKKIQAKKLKKNFTFAEMT